MRVPEEELRDQNNFQEMLIVLATNFINLPTAEIDQGIVEALRQIVDYMGALRCSINQFNDDLSAYTCLYDWTPPANPLDYPRMARTPNPTVYTGMLGQGKLIAIRDVADLPTDDDMKSSMSNWGMASLIVVPILGSSGLFGFVSMSWGKPMVIEPGIRNTLRLVASIFLNTMERKRTEERIERFSIELEQHVNDRTAELRQTNELLQNEIHERQQVEAALRESENQLRATLDALPIPVAVMNEDRQALYINPVAGSMFGVDIASDPDLPTRFVLEADDRIALVKRLEEQHCVKSMEVRLRTGDSQPRTALVSLQPFQYAGQRAILAALVDITTLKEAQEVERGQRNLMEALLDSSLALNSSLQLDEVVTHVLTNLQRVIPHDIANIMIIEGEYALVVGLQSNIEGVKYGVIGNRLSYKGIYYPNLMLKTRQPVVIRDIRNDPLFVRISSNPEIKGYVGLPIIAGQDVIGFINLGSQQLDYFTKTHVSYLQIFAMQAGIAIQNAQLYTQAQTIATLEERQRLARDLHDSVTQTLFSANSIAEALPHLLHVNLDKTEAYLQDLHRLTRGAMAEMRSLLVELRPESLTQTELGLLLGQLCDVFTGRTQIEVDRKIEKRVILPPEHQIAFYRVAQEALNNIVKHAAASHVYVTLLSTDGVIEMRIRDDGKGFDPENIPASHFGLTIIGERAQEIQAELTVWTERHRGTEIILRSALT